MTPSLPLRRPRLLVVGCGDIGVRVLRLLRGRWRLLALTSSTQRVAELRREGATALVGDLDQARTLRRLAALADAVLHLAPPPAAGEVDPRTANLVRALRRSRRCRRLVYASTTGVYGDAGGERFDETRAVAPATERARRRVDAEQRVREFGRGHRVAVTVLRIPGIYAFDRSGGDPRERLRRGATMLQADDDVCTNHIHADDLARACVAALVRGGPQRVVHVCDDSELKMGDWFDLVARLAGLPAPLRIARAEAVQRLAPLTLSFMSESRRLANRRLKRELRLRLRYPTVEAALRAPQSAAFNDGAG